MLARQTLRLALSFGLFLAYGPALAWSGVLAPPAQGLLDSIQNLEDQADELVKLERREAEQQMRHGNRAAARKLLRQHLRDDPQDGASRTLLAEVWLAEEQFERCVEEALQALSDLDPDSEYRGRAARVCLTSWMERGLFAEAQSALQPGGKFDGVVLAEQSPQDAWALVQLSRAQGDVAGARRWADLGVAAPGTDWRDGWARAYCFRDRGDLVSASREIVKAMEVADPMPGTGRTAEPDLLVALGELYFESEQEVEVGGQRSAGSLYREALNIDPGHVGALLGLHALHRLNRQRVSQSPEEILAQLFEAHPNTIAGLVRRTEDDLADGHLPHVRRALVQLQERAAGRRDVQTLRAAIAFVEHRREECEGLLAGLIAAAPLDSEPERRVGRSLLELYRFAEALPFLERAVARDPEDYQAWMQLGRALANVGREDEAREALSTSVRWAKGRQDAWRDNLAAVLGRMHKYHTREDFGPLQFSWQPDAAAVFRAYWVPYYAQAREELAERYGFTPGTTTIEVFREHGDFSVRSVGFEGFPALGVCFGPVVTSLSPLSSMRGRFSWARTGFHEFSHVIHLGLSHNRCPRWITEGLATWEEVNRNPAWTRNMRKELLDARANGQLILVRDLNRAFRGPRILFGYYQGGLLCEMLIEKHGFQPMVSLLEAFDRGEDLDQAIRGTFACTPEDIDLEFAAFVDRRLEGLDCEPLHDPGRLRRLALRLPSVPPGETEAAPSAELQAWVQDWLTVAYGHWQQKNPIEAAEALRMASSAEVDSSREQFLRAALALENQDLEGAESHWRAGFEMGGREYRSLIAMSLYLASQDRLEESLEWLAEAEKSFPGYDDAKLSAELNQAEILEVLGRDVEAMGARERWLAYNPGHYDTHWEVALWHQRNQRFAEAARLFEKANEVDPFRRDLHVAWGTCLEELDRFQDAIREFQVAMVVPPELDLDHRLEPEKRGGPPRGQPLSNAERAAILTRLARLHREVNELETGLLCLNQALDLQPDLEEALDLQERW